MPISKIKSGGINDDAITNAKMADDAVNSAEIADNVELSGTEAARMPVGTTAQRANPQTGDLRFNSTTSLMEYYDGTQWKSIDSPPSISSITPSNIADSDSDVDIVVTGSNFITGGQTVTAIGADGSTITAGTVTRDSSTQLTANFDGTSFDNAQEPYDIKVENSASGLSITSADLLNVNASPAWTVSAGSLGSFYDTQRSGISITTGATDSEGASLTYAVASGSLPSGLSIASSTGTISGTADAVGSDTTSSFTLSVTDGTNTVTRAYSITINAPVVTSYTSAGSGTFTVPSGITTVDVLVVAGGGGGGCWVGSGGGAGGLIYRPAFPVTPGGSLSYTVGNGGTGAANNGSYTGLQDTQPADISQARGNEATNAAKFGQDSVFGTLTAKGGGRGGSWNTSPENGHLHGGGGSGGGAPSNVQTMPQLGGQKVADYAAPGIQPQQPGDSGTYGFGNAGGTIAGAEPFPSLVTAGGGGSGATGGQGQGQAHIAGSGGVGKQYGISGTQTYYAGGGGGGVHGPNPGSAQAGTGGQGGGGNGVVVSSTAAQQGTSNRGGGGGGAGNSGGSTSTGGTGGSGVVIVSY